MEYENTENIAFARSSRATNLDEYVGNNDIKDTLRLYFKNKKPQSIFIEGNSGCGKTTISRIIGKMYCCEDDTTVDACNTCMSCQLFDEYIKTGNNEMLPDVYEIDSSDNSTKKDVDSMLSSMEYPAMSGYWKIYIIDEVHLLSKDAMGRLLKSLEEPPEGVLIILCTTDPDKVLPTIKNRCQLKLRVTKPKTTEIMDMLQKICLREDKNYDLSGLRMLVVRSENVVRDSLNNLERVLNTRGDATASSVSLEFKQVSDRLIFDFYNAYKEENYVEYINVLYKIKTEFGFNQFISALTTFTTRGIYIVNSVEVEGLSTEELREYLALFKKFSPMELSRVLSELKKINIGDIETNLMAFMFCKGSEEKVKESVVVADSTISTEDERKFRNSNLQKIESAKLSKGSEVLSSQLERVSLEDASDLFSLEKVIKE